MNFQEFRNLQEAYLDVYEGKVPWNDPNRPLQSGHTPAEKNRAKRARTGVEDPNKSQMDISDKAMSRYGGMKTADDTETSKAPKQKKTLLGKPKPLEHETPPHEFKKDRKLDPKQTGNEYSMNKYSSKGNATRGQARRAVGASFAGRRDGDSSIFPTPIQQGDPRRRTSKKWGGPNPRNINASYDLYDIILSHLLDEGYADTEDSALVIMANMSEDWRESICEELTGERRKRAIKLGYKELATGKEGSRTTQNRDSNLPTKRSGSGLRRNPEWSNPGQSPGAAKVNMMGKKESDRGSGNRAARRLGKKVKDNEDRYYSNDEDPDF
jgi:hypothetical protein